MARSVDPDSASSQFYICDGPQHGLDNGNRSQDDDPGYAVFGVVRVKSGRYNLLFYDSIIHSKSEYL